MYRQSESNVGDYVSNTDYMSIVPVSNIIKEETNWELNDSLEQQRQQQQEWSPPDSSDSAHPKLNLLDGTFFKYLPQESTSTQMVALCMRCPMITKVKGFNNCTSNFLSHLKRKHGAESVLEYQVYSKKKKEEEKTPKRLNMPCTRERTLEKKFQIKIQENEKKQQDLELARERFEENLCNFFLNSMVPLTIVDDLYFRRIFQDLDINSKGLELIDRQTLEYRIDERYMKQEFEIKSRLQSVEQVCLAIHRWSVDNLHMLGITGHWITPEFSRCSEALACRSFDGSQAELIRILEEVNVDFKLKVNKLTGIVTGSSSNLKQPFEQFGVAANNIDGCEITAHESAALPSSSLSAIHLHCSANILSLCMTTDASALLTAQKTPLANIHGALLQKCNVLWQAAGWPNYAAIIQNILHFNLNRPIANNWHSLYTALRQISYTKTHNLQLHTALNISTVIENNEFDYLEEYLTCTEPVADALNILQSDTNAFYGVVLPCLLALRRKLQKLQKNNFTYCRPLITNYLASIEQRFAHFYNFNTATAEQAAIAALAYPRFKNKWLTCLEPQDRQMIINAFKTCISGQLQEDQFAEEKSIVSEKNENHFFDFESDDSNSADPVSNVKQNNALSISKADSLMLHFFAERSQDLDILERHPEIKNIFIKCNTPLSSFAAVQNLFSDALMTCLPQRNKIAQELVEKRILLKYNSNFVINFININKS